LPRRLASQRGKLGKTGAVYFACVTQGSAHSSLALGYIPQGIVEFHVGFKADGGAGNGATRRT
jgi:hypothetical protein